MQNISSFREKMSGINLSKKNKIICDYILNNYSNVIRMTVSELAEELNISTITVLRMAKTLGYSGFREMQKELQRMVDSEYGTKSQGPLPMNEVSRRNEDAAFWAETIRRHMVSNIEAASSRNSVRLLLDTANRIYESHRVYIAGFWKCLPLVKTLEFKLRYVCDDVISICNFEPNEFMNLIGGDGKDCLILFAFHRFPKGVQRILKLAWEAKIRIIIITDDVGVWSAYRDALVLETPRDGEYFSDMSGAAYLCDVLAAIVCDKYMKSDKVLPNGNKRNKAVSGMVLDMDYFAEWPNAFIYNDVLSDGDMPNEG